MNTRFTALPPIPWVHQSGEIAAVWKWETPHFIVTVTGDNRSVYFQVADKSKGRPIPFTDGQAVTFDDAELLIREAVGKAYSEILGYRHYAGHLATTFLLGNAERVDLGPYVGKLIKVVVLNEKLEKEFYSGHATIEHYDLILTSGQNIIRISPSEIIDIGVLTNYGATKRIDQGPASKASRTISGSMSPGCTGITGYIDGTVDHTGPACPIHEAGRRT